MSYFPMLVSVSFGEIGFEVIGSVKASVSGSVYVCPEPPISCSGPRDRGWNWLWLWLPMNR